VAEEEEEGEIFDLHDVLGRSDGVRMTTGLE